jgi:HEAT repeat protein
METVIELLAGPTPPVRLAAATELEVHPDRRAVEPLRRATKAENPAVRKQAEESLAALGKA